MIKGGVGGCMTCSMGDRNTVNIIADVRKKQRAMVTSPAYRWKFERFSTRSWRTKKVEWLQKQTPGAAPFRWVTACCCRRSLLIRKHFKRCRRSEKKTPYGHIDDHRARGRKLIKKERKLRLEEDPNPRSDLDQLIKMKTHQFSGYSRKS